MWVRGWRRKKEGKKRKEKKRKESPRVWREKKIEKKNISQYFHNNFIKNLKVGYY